MKRSGAASRRASVAAAASIGYLTSSPMIRHYTELFGVSPKDERRLALAARLSRASAPRVETAE